MFPRSRVRYAVLPTKTSLWFIQFGGRTLSFSSVGSQVFTTRLVNPSSLFILVAVILSLVSLSLMLRSHRFLISFSFRYLSWITLSHRRTHMRYAAFDMSICRSWVGPWCVFFLSLCSFCCSSLGIAFMHPQPRMVPKCISGQGGDWWGHKSFANVHISCVVCFLHCVRMCLMSSVVLHVAQFSLSLSPWKSLHRFPIMNALCIVL